MLNDALDQIELADRVGLDYVWEVEHHFLAEYSHSSAPEVFLGAATQRTRNVRLGHGIVHVPPLVNHPARIAERIATLDLISGGRVDFGTGEGASAAELGGFGVPRARKRQMWSEAVDVITRMFVEDPFCGWSGDHFHMPPREIVPKPVQKPHPPLWMACSRREAIRDAAERGLGVLSFAFIEPEQAAQWVREYYEIIESDACVPAGFAVNPNFAVVLPMMLHPVEQVAIDRGIDGAHFFAFSLAHYYHEVHVIGGRSLWDDFQERRAELGFVRDLVRSDGAELAVRLLEEGMGSLRGAIGTPEQVRDLIRRYEAAGVDQMIFVLQAGRNRHADICESIELFGKTVLPEFTDRRESRQQEKRKRLSAAIDQALSRRDDPRRMTDPYPISEQEELRKAEFHQTGRAGRRETP